MKKILCVLSALVVTSSMVACSTPVTKISSLRLGMNHQEVIDAMGNPFQVRAAKVFDNEEFTEVWEYRPDIFSLAAITDKYDRNYFVYFENGRLVQWGEHGDFIMEGTTKEGDNVLVSEYSGQKMVDQ